LGAVAAIISCLIIWVPGFFCLRSEITEERRLRIGDMLASSPISRTKYIVTKVLTNMAVLLMLQLLFVVSFIALQFLRVESHSFYLLDYFIPFFIVSIPNLLVLSTITVLFDVIFFLRGIIGNIVFVFFWSFIVYSGEDIPAIDLFYSTFIMNEMQKSAALTYPNIFERSMNFGYNPTDGTLPTFEWNGIVWNGISLFPLLICFCLAALFIFISIICFDRFRAHGKKSQLKPSFIARDKETSNENQIHFDLILTSVKVRSHNLGALVVSEMKAMLIRMPIMQMILLVGGAMILPFLSANVTPFIMLIPIGILSKMGCNNKLNRTNEIIHANCSPTKYLLVSYIAGIVMAVTVSLFQFVYLGINGNYEAIIIWLIGIIFVCALALFCGEFTGNRRLFEALYILIYNMWLNKVEIANIFGRTEYKYNFFYLFSAIILLLLCYAKHNRFIREKLYH
jgi:hypothetical protein